APDYVDGINRGGTAPKPVAPPPTPQVPVDYMDKVVRDTTKAPPSVIRPSNELDRQGHYLMEPDRPDRVVGRNFSPPPFVGPPAEVSMALPGVTPGYNPATRNVDDQVPGGLDFRQHGTD